MRYLFAVVIFSILVTVPGLVSAQYLCVNDKSGKKGAQNQDINRSLDAARDPLTRAFMQSNYSCPAPRRNVTSIKFLNVMSAIIENHHKTKQIKKECIEASLQREPGNEGYSCNEDDTKRFSNSGKSTPCLSQKTVDFVHYAVNQAINCMSSGRAPIDPRFILKKINNETAFNFYLAYSGGKGIGQLTSDPVNEIAGWYRGKTFVEGNAFHVLKDLMDSNNPSCSPFKEIIENDLKAPPPSPGAPRNYCDWVRPGDGVARNLIYSLGYYVHVRDSIVKPTLDKRSSTLARNLDVVNYLTLVAYGPGGPEEAKTLIRSLRLSNGTPPLEAQGKIIKASPYVKQTEEKMGELLKELKSDISESDKKGDTCVQ